MKQIKNLLRKSKKNKNNNISYNNSIDDFTKGRSSLLETKKTGKNFITKYIFFIISFLFMLIISYIIIRSNYFKNKKYIEKIDEIEEEDEDDDYKPDNKSIYSQEKFYNYQEAYNKAKDFVNNNINGVLINTEKVKLSQKPNVSVVIPCWNCKKYILRAIRSIQNQDFSNYEIIIVNDGSKDGSLEYIQELQKEEERIRIISNKVNKGTLYTRSIGTLSANGKYMFPMDSDDMFLDKDAFSVITNIAYKGNFDIVIFNSVYTNLKPNAYTTEVEPTYFDIQHQPNLVLFQPELGYYNIAPSENLGELYFNDELLHGKLIKTKIYKKALIRFGKERYSRYMIGREDVLGCNIIFNTAKSAKFIAKYGYIYVNNDGSISKSHLSGTEDVRNYLYMLDQLIDFTLDSQKNKKVLVNFIIFIFQKKYLKDLLDFEDDNKLFKSCLDRIFNCKYISKELKNEVRKIGKKLTFIKYKF